MEASRPIDKTWRYHTTQSKLPHVDAPPRRRPIGAVQIRGLECLTFDVLEIHRTNDYTQARVLCNETQLPVWVNVWHRYGRGKRSCGVQRAVVLGQN